MPSGQLNTPNECIAKLLRLENFAGFIEGYRRLIYSGELIIDWELAMAKLSGKNGRRKLVLLWKSPNPAKPTAIMNGACATEGHQASKPLNANNPQTASQSLAAIEAAIVNDACTYARHQANETLVESGPQAASQSLVASDASQPSDSFTSNGVHVSVRKRDADELSSQSNVKRMKTSIDDIKSDAENLTLTIDGTDKKGEKRQFKIMGGFRGAKITIEFK